MNYSIFTQFDLLKNNLLLKFFHLVLKKWSLWGKWTECPVTCGGGIVVRQRDCLNSDHSQCPAVDAMDSKECAKLKCVDLSFWSGWSNWSNCR